MKTYRINVTLNPNGTQTLTPADDDAKQHVEILARPSQSTPDLNAPVTIVAPPGSKLDFVDTLHRVEPELAVHGDPKRPDRWVSDVGEPRKLGALDLVHHDFIVTLPKQHREGAQLPPAQTNGFDPDLSLQLGSRDSSVGYDIFADPKLK